MDTDPLPYIWKNESIVNLVYDFRLLEMNSDNNITAAGGGEPEVPCEEPKVGKTRRPDRHKVEMNIRHIREMTAAGLMKAAPMNRDEIKNRPRGTQNGYWESLRKGHDEGKILGYTTASKEQVKKAIETGDWTEVPIFITDFGHRHRWLTAHENKIGFDDGRSLSTLQTDCPEDYEYLMAREVSVSIVSDPDDEFLLRFAKGEYKAVNTNSMHMEPGEMLRCMEKSDTREESEKILEGIISEFHPKTSNDRGKRDLIRTATINGCAKGMNHLNARMNELDKLEDAVAKDLTSDEASQTNKMLNAYATAMNTVKQGINTTPDPDIDVAEDAVVHAKHIKDHAPKGPQKTDATARLAEAKNTLKLLQSKDKERIAMESKKEKLLESMEFDIAMHGPILQGIREAVMEDQLRNDGLTTETDRAINIVVCWMNLSLADKDVWKNNISNIKKTYGENNSARYYNERRFKAGWNRMKAMIHP